MAGPFESLMRKRPCVPLAVLFVLGIVAARVWHLETTPGLSALIAATPFLLFKRSRPWAAALMIFFSGAALYAWRYEIRSTDDLRLIFDNKPALVTVRGRLEETPALRDFYSGSVKTESSYARIRVSELKAGREGWRPAEGCVSATVRSALPSEFFEGRTVEVSGVIDGPKRAAAPGLFDYREYLYHSRIFYQLKCESTNDWKLLSFEPMPLTEKFRGWAQRQLQRGLPLQDEPLEMLWTMVLGWKQSFSGEVRDAFMKTGTMLDVLFHAMDP